VLDRLAVLQLADFDNGDAARRKQHWRERHAGHDFCRHAPILERRQASRGAWQWAVSSKPRENLSFGEESMAFSKCNTA
jgi:hypothetical protein